MPNRPKKKNRKRYTLECTPDEVEAAKAYIKERQAKCAAMGKKPEIITIKVKDKAE